MNKHNFNMEIFKALSDETRLEILNLLGSREMCVSEIASFTSVSRPTISHHLSILKKANLVTSRKDGKEIYYSVIFQNFTNTALDILKYVSKNT